MQAIVTKYLSPTNTKGSRIKATCAAGSITVDFHSIDALHYEDRHQKAADMLREKLGWGDRGGLVSGGLPNGDYCHVFTTLVTAAKEMHERIKVASPSGNPWRKEHACRPVLEALAEHVGCDMGDL